MEKIIQVEPWIDQNELIQLKRIIESTYVTESKLTKEFELLTQKYTNSPTHGFHLALSACHCRRHFSWPSCLTSLHFRLRLEAKRVAFEKGQLGCALITLKVLTSSKAESC